MPKKTVPIKKYERLLKRYKASSRQLKLIREHIEKWRP